MILTHELKAWSRQKGIGPRIADISDCCFESLSLPHIECQRSIENKVAPVGTSGRRVLVISLRLEAVFTLPLAENLLHAPD